MLRHGTLHMDEQLTKSFYPVKSAMTKRLYISEEGECFLFENEKDAAGFVREAPPGHVEAGRCCRIPEGEMLKSCFARGAKRLRYRNADKTERIYEFDADRYYLEPFDNALSFALSLFLETGRKSCLKELGGASLYVPARIEEGPMPRILYCSAKKGGEKRYLAFTSLDAFESWSMLAAGGGQAGEWEALQMDMSRLCVVAAKSGLLLDAGAQNLDLPPQLLRFIAEKTEKKREET